MRTLIASSRLGVVSCHDGASPGPTEPYRTEFQSGQTWLYRTRPGEEASRITVCRVESHAELGSIVHVHVDGVAIKNPGAPGGFSSHVQHMPFSADALRRSVVAAGEPRRTVPDYEEGYDTWRQAFDRGPGGIFTVSVAEGLDFVEQVLGRSVVENGLTGTDGS